MPLPAIRGKNVHLFLDFDGTLAPIVRSPENARLPDSVKKVLNRLARAPGFQVTVVSGRSLRDIQKRVGIRGMTYGGNHGLEISGPGFRYAPPLPRAYHRALACLRPVLNRALRPFPGAILEDKDLTLSVHYRRLAPGLVPSFKRTLKSAVSLWRDRGAVALRTGKKVLEIRPPISWGKGDAVLWLLNRNSLPEDIPVYIGDDRTDEDAFAALRGKGITIRVGRSPRSAARYRLNGPGAVEQFLKNLPAMQGAAHE
ncbi:trehalose-phosphatase [bacterium]|nr:trehalose-phosphatase [bacterium]